MSATEQTTPAAAIEECLDELNDFVATLDRFPPTTLAVAMSVHLQSILRALLEFDLCTKQQVREFVDELEREIFEQGEA
jgi:hypothetical protein